MTAGIGHNSGRVDAPGAGWRRFAWTKARAQLLPKLPVEVVRLRVRRAEELGLPYKTYASFRASTGHDLIGFLFSSNALRALRSGQIDVDRAAKLDRLVHTDRVALCHSGIAIDARQIDASYPAPAFAQNWSATRDHLKSLMRTHGAPADRFVLVGETMIEDEWADMLQTAGYLASDRYFCQPGA